MTPVVKSIALAGAVTVRYAEQGDPSGAPVLFLHGVTDSWRSFEPVLPHLRGRAATPGYFPVHLGLRFSRNARTPSLKSSLV